MKLQKVLEVFEQSMIVHKIKRQAHKTYHFLISKKFIQGRKLLLEEYFRTQYRNKQDIQ